MNVISPLLGYSLKMGLAPLETIKNCFFAARSPYRNIKRIKNRAYGKHRLQKLDVYLPAINSKRPIAVLIHGGAWLTGDKSYYHAHCEYLADAGYVVFSVNYRLAPRFSYTAQINDVAESLHWIYRNAEKFHGDNSRLFIAGDCAGANLACAYSAAVNDFAYADRLNIQKTIPSDALKGIVLISGTYDLELGLLGRLPLPRVIFNIFLNARKDNFTTQLALASPLRHIDGPLPSTLIASGETDLLCSQSLALSTRCFQVGTPQRLLLLTKRDYPSVEHGFFKASEGSATQMVLKECVRFMNNLAHKKYLPYCFTEKDPLARIMSKGHS